MRPLLLGLVVSLALPATAQKASAPALQVAGVGDCQIGFAEAVLDVGEVRAALYNIGALFWRGGGGVGYEVPAGFGASPMFVTSLWIGGLAQDSLRFAGSTYGNPTWEFWPGPLDANGETTPERCSAFDRIWTVSDDQIDSYTRTGTAARDLREWPVAFGAPFYTDLDGDDRQGANEPTVSLDLGEPGYGTREIDLEAGERPAIYGRQTAWWVMHDNGGEHEWSGAPALGVEVRAMAWSTGYVVDMLERSTFYRYEIINRSDEVLEDVYAGLFVDADIGGFNDDYAGSDSTRSMLYFYNGDDFDDGFNSFDGYGSRPPAFGVDVLSGASSATHPRNSTEDGDPDDAAGAYNYLRGRWRDGAPVRVGGTGRDTVGAVTRWSFSGDAVEGAYWSEENVDGAGTSSIPADRRGVIASEPAVLRPSERTVFDVALVFALGDSRLESVSLLRDVSDAAQAYYDGISLPVTAETDAAAPALALDAFPNPASSRLEVGFALGAAGPVRLAVYDVLGREVAVLEDGPRPAGEHRAGLGVGALSPGVYVVVLEGAGTRASRTVTVVR